MGLGASGGCIGVALVPVNLSIHLRARYLDAENRLDFIDVTRIVDTIAAALNLRDDGDVHITFLREFLLREFLVASRLADGVASDFGDVFRLLHSVFGSSGSGDDGGCGILKGGSRRRIFLRPRRLTDCYRGPILTIRRSITFGRAISILIG